MKVDTANVYFMAHGDDPTKISLETSLDDDELAMDELATFFEELQERYEILKVQNERLRKENEILKTKLDIVFKEKEDLSIYFKKVKNSFDSNKLLCKGKNPNIVFEIDEFECLKK